MSPDKVNKQMGADINSSWVASVDSQQCYVKWRRF